MGFSNTQSNNPFRKPSHVSPRDDWEDWEDDDRPGTIILDDDNLTHDGQRDSLQRYSVQKPIYRAKSRGHTKAKIAKAGITLDTDVFKSRQTPRLSRKSTEQSARPGNAGRFADAAALKALEGSPNSASVGSFSWLRRKHGNLSAKSPKNSPLSPESRPIVIGIAMPSDTASEHQVSPQTAVVETPLAVQQYNLRLAAQQTGGSATTPGRLHSVWSPDTEASESPHVSRTASSVYSQMTIRGGAIDSGDAPPVPTLPATYKLKQTQQQALIDMEDDDAGTPCTLFEEDGSPLTRRKSMKPASAISPEGTGKSKGWWDTVRISQQTNMSPQTTNPFRQTPQQTGESSSSTAAPNEWWNNTNENEKRSPPPQSNLTVMTAAVPLQNTGQSSRSVASSSQHPPNTRTETQSEKARILLEENQTRNSLGQPPPYTVNEVKYGVILPPSHFVDPQPIPSPGLMSPGLSGTMTSQGAIMMSDVPITPRRVPAAVLPERPVGTYVSHDQFREASGTNFRTERNRRRHEKEEFAARKAGGYWRGRGCIPAEGCFGRTGREGRKRRRMCLGIFGGVIALIILIVVLAVLLTRKSITSTHDVSQSPVQSPEQTQAPVDTVWLNLTGFPPMPTGVLTVSGPDNSETTDSCLQESAKTMWSCSIPKDRQDPESLYEPDQPEFIFQIQFDNNTRALWNISDTGEQPSQTISGVQSDSDQAKELANSVPGRRAFSGAIARAAAFIRRAVVYDTGFSPNPAPPTQAEMFFLGNTTDQIVSDEKAGEPTPFFISMLSSIDATVGPDVLSKRGIGNGIDTAPTNGSASQNVSHFVDAPTDSDGTPQPAVLFPLPSQQPVRLYDRGLAAEHYGFYTYFNKSIYISNQTVDNSTDEDGGALLKDATALVVWFQARFLVKMWTRLDSPLLGNGTVPGTDGTTVQAQPGTMPYPVTIVEDFHGGDENTKAVAVWDIGDGERVDQSSAKLVTIDKGAGGTPINPMGDANESAGGIDGGSGGCKCGWVNFVTK